MWSDLEATDAYSNVIQVFEKKNYIVRETGDWGAIPARGNAVTVRDSILHKNDTNQRFSSSINTKVQLL